MSTPGRQPKRPYVRPRIGSSIYRSMGYAGAFLVLLIIAFLVPRSSAPPPSVEGDWRFVLPAAVGNLPAGPSVLLLHGDHYTIRTDTTAGAVRVEFGAAVERDAWLVLEPTETLTVDGRGGGTHTRPGPHTFRLRYRDGELVLESDAGVRVTGERRPFLDRPSGTAEERR